MPLYPPADPGGGGLTLTRVLFTVPSPGAAHTALADEITAVDTTSGSGTVKLPQAPASSTLNAVKQVILGTGNSVTVQCQGSDVINKPGGSTTDSLTLASQGVLFEYDSGSAVWTVLADDLPLTQLEALFLQLTGGAVTGAFSTVPSALTDASSIVVNAALSNVFRVTLGGNRTLANPSNPADGQAIAFEVIQDATGSRTLAYGSAYSFPASIGTPVLSATPAYHDFIAFRYDLATTTWYCVGFVPQSVNATPATVAQGGTGLAALTAYELLAAGTTSTGTLQQIAAGAAGTLLMGAGGSAPPAFTAADSTAADFAAAGAQAAGATGKWADAGHVHPDTYGAMGGLGTILGLTMPFVFAATTFTPTAGVLQCTRLRVPEGGTSGSFYAFISTAGATPANVYAVLFSVSGTIVAQSAQRSADTALTTSASLWTVPWVSGPALAAGDYYGAILIGSAGTMPVFRSGIASSAAVVNLGCSAAAVTLKAASAGSTLTSPPASVTMSAMSSTAGALWMAVGP
jgi:hypothetical protein